ncbi:uncharacterized protein LOC106055221 [Biomphalaria glabrata]|uniref:Uncharacterized protein LOC106055221 n=1 Tax=Biomphalaria glabrata TaxID=6526 RepID=A0A9W2YVZ2_BIOGL|nr:uncharacterized protein LOC106055221 [Biomphalaria glabrata]XP_055866894.1 uncharacterized protein LOC106055221 [Biomphalaria glabrata]XP_055866895.1 uncharacterized protein LOC106055221 [Biomphalaria glabrata]
MSQPTYPSAGYYVPPPAAQAPPPAAQAPPPYAQAPPPAAQVPPPYAQVPPPAAQAPPPSKSKGGFFSNLKKEAEKASKQLGKELDKAGKSINEAVDQNYQSALLDMFRNGNTVQLVSRITGQSLQIVLSPQGQNVLDARGPLDPPAFNTVWTVVNEGKNQVHLHNYHNYIAVNDGVTFIKHCPPGSVLSLETKFQLSQTQRQFVTLESVKEKNRHVGFLPTGELKPALASTKEIESQLGVRLISTGIPAYSK